MSGLGSGSFGPGSNFRFSERAPEGRSNTFRYPSPWWDVAHMDLPKSVKHLFKWCRYHVLVNPLVSSVVKKMAAYPITQLVIDDEPDEGFDRHKKRWEDLLFRVLNINSFQLEIGLDFHSYGNCVVSVLFPFHKYLQCQGCGYRERIKRLKFRQQWDFRNFKYTLTCPRCSHVGDAKVRDEFYKSYRDIKLIRWNPADLDIDFNPITRKTEYAYSPPEKIRMKVLRKSVTYLEELPNGLIEAMRTHRPFVLTGENVFHFRAPTPSLEANDEGWGYPPILPALKDSFYLQVMKKAQEAIMLEHLVPLDIIYPASADAAANPYLTINLADWKRRIETELTKWRLDPNHKPILPVPVGYQRIGGNGRALMLTQEIRAWSEHIIAGMGVPQEFAFGGLSWSGSSVSLRMLENQFLTYRDMHEHFIRHFLIPHISRFMGWSEVSVHMKQFKMADDMQSKQMLMSLNQLRKISDKTLLAEFDKNAIDELKIIEQETRRTLEVQKIQMLSQQQMQGEGMQVQAKYQAKAQEIAQKASQRLAAAQQQSQPVAGPAPQGPTAGPATPSSVNVIDMADAWARRLSKMAPEERVPVLGQLQQQMPQLHQLVQEKLSTLDAMSQEPLPEQRPPRRPDAGI